ncbi:unnamed protein product [Caenorhabditis bovis]|uniref:MANSC domain-containing protein n=1 Tax=Caenorhabditis bovis TaxID=2654633 RepID=A0A8S1F086_9PELO|nr:unnamed protein product [Caenorhabditis bovis]
MCAVAMRNYSLLLLFEILPVLFNRIDAIDTFCGQLEVFNEQRFGDGAVTVSSQTTSDLKQCLDVCCAIPNCDGVTFEGITNPEFDDANCLLVSCEPRCHLNAPNRHSAGVLSVLVHREKEVTTTTEIPITTNHHPVGRSLTPFWVLAVAISVAAMCIGLNVTLCLVYCCYCRRKKRSQKAHISTVVGGPTLHAYNPTV